MKKFLGYALLIVVPFVVGYYVSSLNLNLKGQTIIHRIEGIDTYDIFGPRLIITGLNPKTKEVIDTEFYLGNGQDITIYKDIPAGETGYMTWKENYWTWWDWELHLPE